MHQPFPDFLEGPVEEVAQRLLGCELHGSIGSRQVRVRIVETEAYDQTDEASHAYRGQTVRNATMFGPAGRLYVYFTYGMHYCMNIVAGKPGYGAGVLIRAVEPLAGMATIVRRRGRAGINATNGPAKLTQALAVDLTVDGHNLHYAPLQLVAGRLRPNEHITAGPRIGISHAREIAHRFFIAGNPYVSSPPHGTEAR